jgi:predicted MFS family arabinose efflux permease
MTAGAQVPSRLAAAAGAFASNARNANLRRAQLSFLGAWTAEWAFTVGLGIVAYRDGGPTAVGLVGLLRMVPSAVATPLLAPLADRGRRERVLVLMSLISGVGIAVAALVVGLDGPPQIVYALAAISSIAGTVYLTAFSALLPSLCHTGHELASANVVRGLLDSVATLVGPLMAAVLLQFTGVTAVFAVAAGSSLLAAAMMLRVHYQAPPRPPARRMHLLPEISEGVRAVVRNRDLTLLVGLTSVQTFTRGALTVFTVVVAIDLLQIGEPGVGTLTAAVGAGAVLGSGAVSLLVGTRRLASWFGLGVALWGLPIALIGLFPAKAVTLGLLACVGVANTLVDVGVLTLMARLTPDDVLARVSAVLESLIALTVGLGAFVASLVIDLSSVRPALIVIGALCPLAAAAGWLRLRRLDQSIGIRDQEIELLHEVALLRPLPLPAIEHLARRLEPVSVPAGHTVFHQGDMGDRFYVIESGEAEVVGDGRLVATLGHGEGFGEIALMRRVPRTATVRAAVELRLQALSGDTFLPVVCGFTPSAREAGKSVETMLDRFTPRDNPDEPNG